MYWRETDPGDPARTRIMRAVRGRSSGTRIRR